MPDSSDWLDRLNIVGMPVGSIPAFTTSRTASESASASSWRLYRANSAAPPTWIAARATSLLQRFVSRHPSSTATPVLFCCSIWCTECRSTTWPTSCASTPASSSSPSARSIKPRFT